MRAGVSVEDGLLQSQLAWVVFADLRIDLIGFSDSSFLSDIRILQGSDGIQYSATFMYYVQNNPREF